MKSTYRVVHTPPLILRIAYFLQKNGIRGGYYLEGKARSMGWFDVLVRVELARGVKIDIPAYTDSYHLDHVKQYEHKPVNLIQSHFSSSDQPVILLDCGADIGVLSALLVSTSDCIKKVIAFEPNARSFSRLAGNLNLLPVEAEAKNMAVANFSGMAELRHPDHDAGDHAAYIEPSAEGDIPVIKLDDLDLPEGYRLICKIDVEGGELAVLEGALKTLSSSEGYCVVFEAHRDQVKRTGIDPLKLVSLLGSIRPCKTVVAEAPDHEIDLNRPFFDQFQNRIYNICVFSD